MAVGAGKPTPADEKSDPRHPDTTADRSATENPANMPDPEVYGFTTIDPEGAVEAANAGPGVVEPEKHHSVNAEGASTFASRKAEREKRGDAKVRPDQVTSK